MKLFIILSFSLCVLCVQVINGIILHDIEVPEMVKIDNEEGEPIKLDCEYELTTNPSYLVVKWFMNDKNIYQWIRGKQPSVLPYLKHHIGDIEPTSSDPNHEYRGLYLVDPSIDLSGTYKCLVQTDTDSKSKEKELRVVDMSNMTITFKNQPVQNETYLECTVTNVFPKPRLHLVSADDNIILTSNETRIDKQDNDYYNATMTAVAQNFNRPDTFSCFVTFDGLPLNITADTQASSGINCSPVLWLMLVICCSSTLLKLL